MTRTPKFSQSPTQGHCPSSHPRRRNSQKYRTRNLPSLCFIIPDEPATVAYRVFHGPHILIASLSSKTNKSSHLTLVRQSLRIHPRNVGIKLCRGRTSWNDSTEYSAKAIVTCISLEFPSWRGPSVIKHASTRHRWCQSSRMCRLPVFAKPVWMKCTNQWAMRERCD